METRIYKTVAARKSALRQLQRSGKWNYFVLYRDARGPGLQIANAAWLKPGVKYVI